MNVDYIGWAGHGNLGDDACLEAIRRLFAPHQIQCTPDPTAGLCILGGGTLIYGTAWLQPALQAVTRGAKLVVFGSGVDLSVPLARWEPSRRRAWADVLGRAQVVGVRGELSLRAVRQLGAGHARIIGDPALTLGRPRWPDAPHHQQDPVLLNAGSDFQPGGGRQRTLGSLAQLARWLQRRGLRVEYLPLRPNDLTHGRPLVERLGLAVVSGGLHALLERVHTAHMVVSLRLHGAVFAAAFGIPCVLLGYHPKCQDFATSIGAPCIPTGQVTFNLLRDSLERLEANYEAVASRLSRFADQYRRLQQETAEAVLTMFA